MRTPEGQEGIKDVGREESELGEMFLGGFIMFEILLDNISFPLLLEICKFVSI